MLHEPMVLLAGITVGNFAFWADSLLVAVLLHYGASSFQRVAEVKCDNQLPSIFQVTYPCNSPDGASLWYACMYVVTVQQPQSICRHISMGLIAHHSSATKQVKGASALWRATCGPAY